MFDVGGPERAVEWEEGIEKLWIGAVPALAEGEETTFEGYCGVELLALENGMAVALDTYVAME